MRPAAKPATPRAASHQKRPQWRSSSAVSIGSTAPDRTSQSRKTRMPVASADSAARAAPLRFCMRPTGRPRKIVPPAIAPRIKTWAVLTGCKGSLTSMAERHSVDEYLETIYFLAFPIGEYTPHGPGSPPLAARVAEMLGVSRASAGEMLKRLEAEGLIERGERKEALLTDSGRARAERVVRKHRIIERLLTDFMGYTGYESHERADALGDTFTDEMIERIDERLGHPERCPHGWPVDPGIEQSENAELAPLATLTPGTKATIVRLAEHDGDLLHWFYDQGLVPGTSVVVRAAEPAADQFTVSLDDGERAISEKAAAGLFVRPAS